MAVMGYLFIVVFLVALISSDAYAGAPYLNLSVRYDYYQNGFWPMPTSVTELKNDYKDFVYCGHDDKLNVDHYSYKDDPRVSLLFDSYGSIAGIRTGYIKADIPNTAISKGKVFPADYFTKKPGFGSETIWNIDCWTITALFDEPSVVRAGGRSDRKGVVLEDLYLNHTGIFTKVDKDECQAEKIGFHKQACFPGMGMHYFYNMTTSLDCSYANGIFVTFESGQLFALGLIPFGSYTSKGTTWFEDVTTAAIEAIVPNRPACLTEYFDDYSASSLHIYFKASPNESSCTSPWQKSDQCQ